MFKTTILKLREQESTLTENNGSYTTTLAKSILLEEGDQVQIKSAIIDTTAETTITVEKDFTASITTAKYLTNYYDSTTPNGPGVGAPTNPFAHMMFTGEVGSPTGNTPGPDLKKYWSCDHTDANVRNKLLKTITVIPIRNKKYGDLRFFLQVRNPAYKEAGDAPFVPVVPNPFIKKIRWEEHKTFDVPINCWVNVTPGEDPNTAFKIMPFTGSEAGDWAKNNMKVPLNSSAVFGAVQSGGFSQLITDVCNIPISAGEYSPTEIATIMSDAMGVLVRPDGQVGTSYPTVALPNPPGGGFLVDSPFLSSTFQDYIKGLGYAGNLPTPAADNPTTIFMSEGEKGIFSNYYLTATVTNDSLLGTNNASLIFDSTLNKMVFNVMHFPVQVATGTTYFPGIVYSPSTSESSGFSHNAVQSYSGVGFVDFEPPDFWANLGFTRETNCVTAPQSANTIFYAGGFFSPYGATDILNPPLTATPKSGREVHYMTITSEVGKNCTEQYAGMGLVVTNTADTWMNPDLNTVGVVSDITTPIIGDRQFNGSATNDGFYMIDIGVKLQQNMIGSNDSLGAVSASNTLQSIIGKYYTQGNFLQDDGSGSIAYTHVGDPQLLSSFDIRVLNGDGSIPINTDIGNNTTIFLEVTKAVSVEQPTQSK